MLFHERNIVSDISENSYDSVYLIAEYLFPSNCLYLFGLTLLY